MHGGIDWDAERLQRNLSPLQNSPIIVITSDSEEGEVVVVHDPRPAAPGPLRRSRRMIGPDLASYVGIPYGDATPTSAEDEVQRTVGYAPPATPPPAAAAPGDVPATPAASGISEDLASSLRPPPRRFHHKKVFLTIPNAPKDWTLERVVEMTRKIPDYQGCVVAREQHADGRPHFHLVVWCTDLFRQRGGADAFNSYYTAGRGGATGVNAQTVRHLRKCIQYVIKDGDFLSDNIDIGAIMKKQGGATVTGALYDAVTAGGLAGVLADDDLCRRGWPYIQRLQSFMQLRDAALPREDKEPYINLIGDGDIDPYMTNITMERYESKKRPFS